MRHYSLKRLFFHAWQTLLYFLVGTTCVQAQLTLQGPVCVLPQVRYQYIISNSPQDSGQVTICISGGHLLNDSTCSGFALRSALEVIWTDSTTGAISLGFLGNNTTLPVEITSELQGGNIDSVQKRLLIDSSHLPLQLFCSGPSGGNCHPVYVYQWERSENLLNWEPVSQAIFEKLTLDSLPASTCFFRRKVTELHSSSRAFSEAFTIIPVSSILNPTYETQSH